MAGETRGRIAEALCILALKDCPKLNARIEYWDKPHPSLRWKPDVLAITSRGRLLILVTYSGSETHSKEKFWRNVAETIDAKLQLDSETKAIALTFKVRMRVKLEHATAKMLDGFVKASSDSVCSYKKKLLDASKGKSGDELTKLIERELWIGLPESDRDLFRETLCSAASVRRNNGPNDLWPILGKTRRRLSSDLSPRNLSISRAVAQYAVLSDDHKREVDARKTRLSGSNALPAIYKQLGIVSGLASTPSTDLVGGVRAIGPDLIRLAATKGLTATGRSALGVLSQARLLDAQNEFVRSNFKTLSSAAGMRNALIRCFGNPSEMINSAGAAQGDIGCWLYTYLKNLFAVHYGRQGQEWIEEVGHDSAVLRSILVGLHFPKFERREAMLPPKVLDSVSRVFAGRLSGSGNSAWNKHEQVVKELIGSTVSNRLVAHGFQTPWFLVKEYLRRCSLSASDVLIPSSVSEYCGLDKKTGSTRFLRVGRTIIHCKLLTKDGRDHKTKELFARSALTRVRFSEGGWVERAEISRMLLVLDGAVRKEDLDILSDAWWDGVFYVDDLSGLRRAIVL